MKVVVSFPGEAEGAIKTDAEEKGAEPDFDKIEIEPFFFNPSHSPTVMYIQVKNSKGKVVQQVAVKVSGQSGKITTSDRSKRVKPQLDVEAQHGP
jgi:hypothetical protein